MTVLAALAAGAMLTACSAASSGTGPSAAATAATAAASSAQPETAAAARAAASQYFGLNSAGQFAAEYALLDAAARQAVSESTWVAVHQGCRSPSAGLADTIKDVTITGNTAVVTVTLTGALSKLATASEAFVYATGQWGYAPSDLDLYQHGSVSADVAAAKARGLCAG